MTVGSRRAATVSGAGMVELDGNRGSSTPIDLGCRVLPVAAAARRRGTRSTTRPTTAAATCRSAGCRARGPRSGPASRGGPDDQAPAACVETDPVVADQRGCEAARAAGEASARSARRDLPRAGRPADQHRAARRPARSEACTVGAALSHSRRQPHDEARAAHLRLAVRVGRCRGGSRRSDASAMRLDDLARDRQAEARILAEALVRPVGVEALEDALQRVRRMPGPSSSTVTISISRPQRGRQGDAHRRRRAREKERAFSIRLVITWPSRRSWPGRRSAVACGAAPLKLDVDRDVVAARWSRWRREPRRRRAGAARSTGVASARASSASRRRGVGNVGDQPVEPPHVVLR